MFPPTRFVGHCLQADTMTIQERQAFRTEVARSLAAAGVTTYKFKEEDTAAAGEQLLPRSHLKPGNFVFFIHHQATLMLVCKEGS